MTSNGRQAGKHEQAYQLIRSRILDGTYAPGDRLVIDALANELGISPVPVREAIRRLEAEGRVDYRHNAGARVTAARAPRSLRIGVDTGRTVTDAVLMDGKSILAAVKQPTTVDIGGGIQAALEALLRESRAPLADIAAVIVGTVQFARAFEQRRFAPTACIRLALPATGALPPMIDWPDHLRSAMDCACYVVHGGHAYDGRALSAIREDELYAIGRELRARDVRSVAISSVFSPVVADAEKRAAAMLQAAYPEIMVTLSHQIASLGLLERENAAILNAGLRWQSQHVTDEIQLSLHRLGLGAPIYFTQNDGTLMTVDYAARFPVLTFSSNQANSMRGAGFLAGRRDGVVIDVGARSTAVGMLIDGFPRVAPPPMLLDGLRTSFRMPDVQMLAMGSDSIREALLPAPRFGREAREQTALTAAGVEHMADWPAHVHAAGTLEEFTEMLPAGAQTQAVLDHFGAALSHALQRLGGRDPEHPPIVVGGGAWLARAALAGAQICLPEHYAVANAVGAATAPVSGEVDRVVSLAGISRQEVLAKAVAEAVGKAVAAGAEPATVQVNWAEDIPVAYLPGAVTRIRVKATGSLALKVPRAR